MSRQNEVERRLDEILSNQKYAADGRRVSVSVFSDGEVVEMLRRSDNSENGVEYAGERPELIRPAYKYQTVHGYNFTALFRLRTPSVITEYRDNSTHAFICVADRSSVRTLADLFRFRKPLIEEEYRYHPVHAFVRVRDAVGEMRIPA